MCIRDRYDILGKKVYESFNETEINVKDFQNGIYILKLSSDTLNYSRLFIKN